MTVGTSTALCNLDRFVGENIPFMLRPIPLLGKISPRYSIPGLQTLIKHHSSFSWTLYFLMVESIIEHYYNPFFVAELIWLVVIVYV